MNRALSLNRLLVFVSVTGFAFLLADTTIEHWEIFLKEPSAFIPAIFCFIGLLAGVFALLEWKEQFIKLFQIILLASILVGGLGVYFHTGEDDDADTKLAGAQLENKKEKDKPILAPLSFAGVAVVGLLGTLRKWEAEVRPHGI
jgi:hypothetical protein